MRTLDAGLAAHLASGATTLCMCWRITRVDGAVLGFTDHDRPLTFDGDTFLPAGGADAAPLVSTGDLSIDNAQIEGAFTSDRLTATDLAAGRYDGAVVEIWRVNWVDSAERVRLKRATIGETVREGEAFRAELRGAAYELSRTTGRVYQRTCDAQVGDARCGVDLSTSAFTGDAVVSSVEADSIFLATGLDGFVGGWFDHGALVWTSGANAGVKAHVKKSVLRSGGATRIELWLPAGASIAVADRFTITAGCNRRETDCTSKFANLINFRGFHLMPGDDAAISYPLKVDRNDGGKR